MLNKPPEKCHAPAGESAGSDSKRDATIARGVQSDVAQVQQHAAPMAQASMLKQPSNSEKSIGVAQGPDVLKSKTMVTLLSLLTIGGVGLLVSPQLRDILTQEQDKVLRSQAVPNLVPAPTPPNVCVESLDKTPVLPKGIEALAKGDGQPKSSKQPTGKNAVLPPKKEQAKSKLLGIVDPHRSLRHFAKALTATARKRSGAITRVVHFGDSLIDLDYITGSLRKLYQARYGDAGHGFSPAARPWRWFHQAGMSLFESDGWTHYRLVGGRRYDGRLGLAGVAVESPGGRRWVKLKSWSKRRTSKIRLSFLKRPYGGNIEVWLDGKKQGEVSTQGTAYRSGFYDLNVTDSAHNIRLVTRGRVRLYGMALERNVPGITWDNLPLVSTRMHHLAWLNGDNWKEQITWRKPNLVLFQFGANDTISYGGSIKRYQKLVSRVLKRVRQAAPKSSCLVIGPLDRLERRKGKLHSPKKVRWVSDAQRAAAMANGCAFWDAQMAMGGRGAMKQWLRRRWGRRDMAHLTKSGSRVFARMLRSVLDAKVRQARRHAFYEGSDLLPKPSPNHEQTQPSRYAIVESEKPGAVQD